MNDATDGSDLTAIWELLDVSDGCAIMRGYSDQGVTVSDWIGTGDAAAIVGVSESTVYRSLRDDNAEQRAEWWGKENEGWRRKPLSRRGIFQVSRKRAEELAAGTPPVPES